MTVERERVISISLTESQWRAFTARQPKPVDWLRALILEEAAREEAAEATPAAARTQFTIRN